MIAVAGGTGRLGGRVLKRLAARGLDARVLTREPARAQHLLGYAAEIATCDVRDRASLQSALHGVTTVVSAIHGFAGPGRVSPQSVDHGGNANLVDTAAEVGADVVLLSVVGASAENAMELFRAKYAAEQHLRASGVGWTIVRATGGAIRPPGPRRDCDGHARHDLRRGHPPDARRAADDRHPSRANSSRS